MIWSKVVVAGLVVFLASLFAAQAKSPNIPLTPIVYGKAHLHNVEAAPATYKGRRALRLRQVGARDGEGYLILANLLFRDGTITVDVVGNVAPGAPDGARGFVGIAFRMLPSGQYECFYVRPANGRSTNQEQRNHSTQYVSQPEHPWQYLREKFPGRYESYADMSLGAWTRLKIEVRGEQAMLFVNGASQPSLVVNDLKHGSTEGSVALWVGAGTVAYFSNLRVDAKIFD